MDQRAGAKIEFVTTDGDEDALPLQYIGAATFLRWNELPESVRDQIYKLATSGNLRGLAKTQQLLEQIDRLVRRNASRP